MKYLGDRLFNTDDFGEFEEAHRVTLVFEQCSVR